MARNVFIKGDYNVICDECGFKKKASECKLRWDGCFVCQADWEPRQPQDFLRAFPDNQRVPLPRPEAPDQFITTPVNPEDL